MGDRFSGVVKTSSLAEQAFCFASSLEGKRLIRSLGCEFPLDLIHKAEAIHDCQCSIYIRSTLNIQTNFTERQGIFLMQFMIVNILSISGRQVKKYLK